MTSERYDLISKFCLAVGVVSVLAFERLGPYRWLAGAVAGTCALTVLVAYFRLHCEDDVAEQIPERQEQRTPKEEQHDVIQRTQPQDVTFQDNYLSEYLCHFGKEHAVKIDVEPIVDRMLISALYFQVETKYTRADEIIRIVNGLSAKESNFEFVWEQSGEFVIRPITQKPIKAVPLLKTPTVNPISYLN